MNDTQKYYKDGFTKLKFKNNNTLKQVTDKLSLLYEEKIDKNFEFISKYPKTKDLRPTAFDYDKSFLDILFDNNIPEILANLTGEKLTLAHVQIRKSESSQSYMPWHRDMYFIDDRIVGNIPPGHKIIFYPKLADQSYSGVELLKGSHLCLFQNQPSNKFVHPGCSYLDQQLFQLLDVIKYTQSEDEFLVFNTALLHSVITDAINTGSIRIIYSFVRQFQFDENFSDQAIHLNLNLLYERMLKDEKN